MNLKISRACGKENLKVFLEKHYSANCGFGASFVSAVMMACKVNY